MAGDCFQVALQGVVTLSRDIPGVRLVHGLPIGAGPENNGKRYWHAWVEVVVNGVPMVYDYSNGLRAELPRDRYYALGQIEQVFRYKPIQALRESARHNTYGPWIKGWAAMAEVGANLLPDPVESDD